MKAARAMAVVFLWVCVASGQEPVIYVPVDVLYAKDADTLKVNVNLPLGLVMKSQDVRCQGYDAWETSRRRQTVEVTDVEIERGHKAKRELEELLRGAKVWLVITDANAVYGRIEAKVYVLPMGGRKLLELANVAKEKGWVRE